MVAHGLDIPLDVYELPQGVKFLVIHRSGDRAEALLDALKGDALQLVVDEYGVSIYRWPAAANAAKAEVS